MFQRRGSVPPQFIAVTCEDGLRRLINMETVGLIEPHEHVDGDHTHTHPIVVLRLINGETISVLDDGKWTL